MTMEEHISQEDETVAAAVDAEPNADADEVCNGDNHHKPALRREPSFSRWCDENGILHSTAGADDGSPGTNSADEESEDFELPLLRQGNSDEAGSEAESQTISHEFRQRSMFLGTANGDDTKYATLDIEDGVHTSDSIGKLESLEQSRQSTISAAMVMKTLFYILVWYTFSILLTLYNKKLLGNQFGKFPAPLLMNTIHFSMQAILSNVILYIQSRISQSSRNTMSWKDYFVRVVPTAIGTALDVNLSNESLVFISVTFATMVCFLYLTGFFGPAIALHFGK
ncbi:hypothetical protein Cni_G00117 [Canna indica]|uniref:Sugar phosphate transporter domain-containing protein n=1 Tax=Canna indica TaxID=4628 RepID=A0AAQ3JKW2_9LILI|nr:hypothetical protein Cni_G00117 [Canna indica]